MWPNEKFKKRGWFVRFCLILIFLFVSLFGAENEKLG